MITKTHEIKERKRERSSYDPDNFLMSTLNTFYQVENNSGMDQQIDENKLRNSITKSLSETESIEFFVGEVNPSAVDVIFRSIGNPVPAIAPAPNGHSFSLFRQSEDLLLSRPSIST